MFTVRFFQCAELYVIYMASVLWSKISEFKKKKKKKYKK